jgi:hypothetical protein
LKERKKKEGREIFDDVLILSNIEMRLKIAKIFATYFMLLIVDYNI